MRSETIRKMSEMKLTGMVESFTEMTASSPLSLSPEEVVASLVDSEYNRRKRARVGALLKVARLKHGNACIEDIEFGGDRNLKKASFQELIGCDFIEKRQNILISGPTGTGKSYLACALANHACRNGYPSCYLRVSRFLQQQSQEKLLGNYLKALDKLGKIRLLILDDLGPDIMNKEERNIFFEAIEERHLVASTIITSQLPLDKFYEVFGDPTTADAICDRLFHQAHRLELKGGSRRKK